MKSLNEVNYFVTGTDTDCGKTYVTAQLLHAAALQGKSTLGLKPVSAGSLADVLQLQQASTVKLPQSIVNPFCLTQPLSPHLAAEIDNIELNVQTVVNAIKPQLNQADLCLLEGAGGILVPINKNETILDLMKALNLPVILVVGMRLGCLNHAQLSYQALAQANLKIAGWVAAQVDKNMQCYKENIETLKEKFAAPLLAQFNHNDRACQNKLAMPYAEEAL